MGRWLPTAAPFAPMPDNPISQGFFKPDIVPGFFRFDPFMPQNLIAFCLKFPVKGRFFDQIAAVRAFCYIRHKTVVFV
jgi:hypothetical protein